MSEEQKLPPEELTKFQQLARALFRVDRKDVPKHEPKHRPRVTPEASHPEK